MPVFILLGWLVGLLVGSVAMVLFFIALGFGLPVFVTVIATLLGPLAALLSPVLVVVLAAVVLIVATIIAYAIATAGVAPSLPTGTTFPLPMSVRLTPPVTVAPTAGEFFGRGMLIGLSAAANSIMLSLIPPPGSLVSIWAFTVISLSAIIFVARNRVYQGFLGWSGWLFPLSWLATAIGLILFVVNFFFAFAMFGIAAFAVDFTTGTIETRGGFIAFGGGFSLGNFIFLGSTVPPALIFPGRFTAASISSHETGHTLNTAATGGIMLWVNTIDQSVFPARRNFAYGEMIAEGHARGLPGTPAASIAVMWWF
ncbi:MAG: hypothetical protein K8S21_04660 [Gemmatimonadetes bacterium]|nr:hypothetical protein [Gemmatimonadota bacterium]